MTGCSKLAPRVQGDTEFSTELNLFFSRFDTTPHHAQTVCLDAHPPSLPPFIPLLETLLPIKDMATSASLSTLTLAFTSGERTGREVFGKIPQDGKTPRLKQQIYLYAGEV